jgi:secondary thiamine-phosphate synthase enzyme
MESFTVSTKGHTDVIDITDEVAASVERAKVDSGMVLVFAAHSTAAITTIEYESGVINDIKNILEKIAPEAADYEHHKRWGDHNGAAHIKSAILGVDQLVPISKGKLVLGTWQQLVLIDFDERPRQRKILIRIIKND